MTQSRFQRGFLLYDVIGLAVLGAGLFFFYLAFTVLATARFFVGILVILIGVYVFAQGIEMLKVSAASKAVRKES